MSNSGLVSELIDSSGEEEETCSECGEKFMINKEDEDPKCPFCGKPVSEDQTGSGA